MCSICDLRIEFGVDHPLSLTVAVETRKAIDAGLLPEPEFADDPAADASLRSRAVESLRAAQQRLERSLSQEELLALPEFFVLMIESRTWGYFRPTATGFDPNCQPDPPKVDAEDAAARDAVLVASELAMREIAAGALPFSKAVGHGLVALDADPARYRSLADGWKKAYPDAAFSRFVCA